MDEGTEGQSVVPAGREVGHRQGVFSDNVNMFITMLAWDAASLT